MNRVCSTDVMVGETNGIKAVFDAKRKELESVKISISAQKYTKLSQELAGYNAQWESLNRDVLLACKKDAQCSYRVCSPDNCKSQQDRYDAAVQRANGFFLDVKKLDVVGDKQN